MVLVVRVLTNWSNLKEEVSVRFKAELRSGGCTRQSLLLLLVVCGMAISGGV